MIGFMHGVRGTKPSLALDVMEEMRALLVDRLVATLVNRSQLEAQVHTRELPGGGVEFTKEGLRVFLDEWAASRQRPVSYTHLDVYKRQVRTYNYLLDIVKTPMLNNNHNLQLTFLSI